MRKWHQASLLHLIATSALERTADVKHEAAKLVSNEKVAPNSSYALIATSALESTADGSDLAANALDQNDEAK